MLTIINKDDPQLNSQSTHVRPPKSPLRFFQTVVYPIYRSVSIYRKHEDPANLQRILKYWVIVFLVSLLQSYLSYLLELVEMKNLFFAPFYAVLLWDNFKYTEFVYEFMVEEGFDRCSSSIEAT